MTNQDNLPVILLDNFDELLDLGENDIIRVIPSFIKTIKTYSEIIRTSLKAVFKTMFDGPCLEMVSLSPQNPSNPKQQPRRSLTSFSVDFSSHTRNL